MTAIAIIYHSGYGHTARQAEAVRDGAATVAGVQAHLIAIDAEGNLPDGGWDRLAAGDAILFGAPTYMGGPSWQFKKFADASSKIWGAQGWKDKLAAGFTNSGTINGDKFNTITYFITLAMQHSMAWIGTGMMPSNKMAATRDDLNYLGGFSGALAQSPVDVGPGDGPRPGDLETARLFGARVATFAGRIRPAV